MVLGAGIYLAAEENPVKAKLSSINCPDCGYKYLIVCLQVF